MLGFGTRKWIGGAALVAAALLAGCGGTGSDVGGGSGGTGDTSGGSGGAGGGGGPVQPASGEYQPLTIGATWSYHVNDKGVPYDKVSVIDGEEDLGGMKPGVMGIKMRETLPAETQITWYQRIGTVVGRLHEQELDSAMAVKSEEWFTPYRLRVDESPDKLVAGVTWSATFDEVRTTRTRPTSTATVTEDWKVEAVDEPVTVPAGTFPALRLTHTDNTDQSTKTYWFVRGIGKVREQTSGGHIEELTSYQMPPAQ